MRWLDACFEKLENLCWGTQDPNQTHDRGACIKMLDKEDVCIKKLENMARTHEPYVWNYIFASMASSFNLAFS